jgi:uncharacterized cupin superfamily protein
VIPEAPLEETELGAVPSGEGWFVLNAQDASWQERKGRWAMLHFRGAEEFEQLGINLFVLAPGEPLGMYHSEQDQEDFLVLAGEPLLLIEGQERPLRQWDFVHCPPGTEHTIVGGHAASSVVLGVGARAHQPSAGWHYPVSVLALSRNAGVKRETTDMAEAYADLPDHPASYRDGWLPGD